MVLSSLQYILKKDKIQLLLWIFLFSCGDNEIAYQGLITVQNFKPKATIIATSSLLKNLTDTTSIVSYIFSGGISPSSYNSCIKAIGFASYYNPKTQKLFPMERDKTEWEIVYIHTNCNGEPNYYGIYPEIFFNLYRGVVSDTDIYDVYFVLYNSVDDWQVRPITDAKIILSPKITITLNGESFYKIPKIEEWERK